MACELCGYNQTTIVHHRDRNRLNNSPKNLQVLCLNCHYLQHHPKGLDGHKRKEGLIAFHNRALNKSLNRSLYEDVIKNIAIVIAEKEGAVYSSILAEYTGISQSLALKTLKRMEKSGILHTPGYSEYLNIYCLRVME